MFTLRFSRQAHKFLEKQSPNVRNRMRTALLELSKDLVAGLLGTGFLAMNIHTTAIPGDKN